MSKSGLTLSTSGTVGATSTQLLPFRGARRFLQIHNAEATGGQSFAFCLNPDAGNPTAAVINGVGCVTLVPGGTATFSEFVPTNAITMIGAGGGTKFTCYYCIGPTGS